ncbi:MAG: DUF3486 family protein [Rhodospirillales bacterium]|nr:DUF3486 family protein [Rhodospirillales bacterium]
MPQRRKVDRLPEQLRIWLKAELEARGFSGYDDVTKALNARLKAEGLSLSIGARAVRVFGAEHAEFTRLQREASGWAAEWMGKHGLEDEARRQGALFEMITTLGFKLLKSRMLSEGDELDPRDLAMMGRMMRDLMASSGLRESLADRERARLAEAERQAGAGRAAEAARQARSAHRPGLRPAARTRLYRRGLRRQLGRTARRRRHALRRPGYDRPSGRFRDPPCPTPRAGRRRQRGRRRNPPVRGRGAGRSHLA